MILDRVNWKPSIARSIGKSHNFLNQLFESDSLRVESIIINPSYQVQINPLTLTVVYTENVEDDVFYIYPGDKNSLIQIIQNLKPFKFKLFLSNPNKSAISITVSLPKTTRIKSTNHQLNYNMSGQSNPSGTDPALAAGIAAIVASNQQIVAATSATTAAVAASDENVLTYDTTTSEMSLGGAVFNATNNQNRIQAPDPKCRELIIANNNVSGLLKLTTTVPADNTAYAAVSQFMGNPIAPGGNFIVSDPTCRDEIYVVGSVANMKVGIVKSAKLP
jgi:hypothetical protein